MLLGVRNWYSELGVTPASVGTDAGSAYGLAELAKPYRGALVRSDKLGTAWGGAGIAVTWPRAVPIRLVGILAEGNTARLFRWTLRNGGAGGTLVAQSTHGNNVDFSNHTSLPTNVLVDLGQRYVGDYLLIEWRILTGPLKFERLWASDALALVTKGLSLRLIDKSKDEFGLTGSERAVELRRKRALSVDAEIDNSAGTLFGAWDSDDEIDSGIEAAALMAGADEAVTHWIAPGSSVAHFPTTIHGRITGAPKANSVHGPRTPFAFAIEEP